MRILLIFFAIVLYAKSVDDLLKIIEVKTDLSQKTKLENGGISFIFTRSDLDRMQVNTLKDLFYSMIVVEYRESSYGFADIYTRNDNKAFVSNSVRIFIDNQEIATGMYGSGFMMLGDIKLDFVDHIEIYYQNPSYEYTTEPTSVLIKLYTKQASKDNGGRVKLQYDNYNSKSGSIYYADELDKFSYFSYFSYDDKNRKRYKIKQQKISRDYTTLNAIASVYDENQRFLLQVLRQNRDSFLDTSIDLTPQKAKVDTDFVHFGYDGKKGDFYLLASVDYKLTKSDFRDDVTPKEEYNYLYPIASQISTIDASLYNLELKYKHKSFKNTFITGLKYRYKTFEYTRLYRNGIALPKTGNDRQIIRSLFLENQYSLKTNSILNVGVMLAKVRNNKSLQQDNIMMYRLGNTYTTNNLTFKTILGHTEFSIDPYLVNSTGFFIKEPKVNKIQEKLFYENIIYNDNNNKYELLAVYVLLKDMLFPDFGDRDLLYNYKKVMPVYNLVVRWTFDYSEIDKFFMSIGYKKIDNFPQPYDKKDEKFFGIVRNLNSYGRYDIFNELILTKVNYNNTIYSVYNFGVKYHYTDDLTISFKAENIFDKAQKQTYLSFDPDTLKFETTKDISPFDRSFVVSMEYLF
jgi:iron complex outermembrane receptor protein